MSSGKVDIATKLKSEPLETQRLLWASEIQGLQFTVILDRERQAITVSQSGRDRTLQVTELNSLVKITVHCDLGSGTSGKDICLSLAGGGIGWCGQC